MLIGVLLLLCCLPQPAIASPRRLTGAKMRSGDEPSINTRIFSFSVNTDGDSEKMETSWWDAPHIKASLEIFHGIPGAIPLKYLAIRWNPETV